MCIIPIYIIISFIIYVILVYKHKKRGDKFDDDCVVIFLIYSILWALFIPMHMTFLLFKKIASKIGE